MVATKGYIQKFLLFISLFLGVASGCTLELGARSRGQIKLTVSAAASMQDALQEIANLYNQKQPQAKIVFNFGSSGSLQHQIEQGAPIDLFISAAPQQMDRLEQQELLLSETRKDLVKNQMVLVVPQDKAQINDFSDLGKQSVEQIALGEPNSVPAGQYAREILTNLNLSDKVASKAVYAKDVRQVLNYVATKNTDAGIVYQTDARNAKVKIVATAPETAYSPVVYPVAVVRDSKNSLAARQMLEFLFTPEAQAIFKRYGFMLPSDKQ